MVFVHFPLPIHRFAVQAAQATECASLKGRFLNFIDAVYRKQDSLGLKSWGSYALEAGIVDTAAIARCAHDSTPFKRVEAGRELGLRWQILGTPTVIINGLRYASPPTKREIDRVIRRAGKSGGVVTDRDRPSPQTSRDYSPADVVPRVVLSDSDIVARSNLRQLFDRIRLSPRQEAEALLIIKRAFRGQFALGNGTFAQRAQKVRELNSARDSALNALLTSESDRARFLENAVAWDEDRIRPSRSKR
jgi:hypothetical protein